MKVICYAPDGAGDKLLVAALMGGAARHEDEVKFVPVHEYSGVVPDADAAACYGVRASTRIILDAYKRAGRRTLFFDKGYLRRGTYTRVAVDAWHPTAYLDIDRPDDRLKRTGVVLKNPGTGDAGGGYILYAATTQTWHDFYDLGPARAMDELIVGALAGLNARRVIYRPRPAYAKKHPELCTPIAGARLSSCGTALAVELGSCRLLVTIGSNAAIEALIEGVPVLVLGDNPARLMNGVHLEPDVSEWAAIRNTLLAALAYCQWTPDEYHSGEAWDEIKRTMARTR